MKKFLIIGLGNKGHLYENTRHNIGFKILDYLSKKYSINFFSNYFGDISYLYYKEKLFLLIKPNTFINLSGKCVKYWMNKENIPIDRILIITDDIYLKLGKFRIRSKGNDGGHNGLKSIQKYLSTSQYPRLRIGIGNEFEKGKQINYVLGKWTKKETFIIIKIIENITEAIISFGIRGLHLTMNEFNKKF